MYLDFVNLPLHSCFFVLQEIQKQLTSFVRATTEASTSLNEDLVKSALYLLRELPSSQKAVLQYLSKLFVEAVETYIERLTLYGDKNNHGM